MVTVLLRHRGRHKRQSTSRPWTEGGQLSPEGEYQIRHVQMHTVRGETVDIAVEGDDPPWLMATLQRCAELLQLGDGWNSYDARTIDPAAIAAALQLLAAVMDPETPAPLMIPTNQGSVSIEWHTHGIDLEVAIVAPDQITIHCEDHVRDREWDMRLGSDLTPLADILTELAVRRTSASPSAN